MSLATVGFSQNWLGLKELQKGRHDLLDVPITAEGLLGSISLMTQVLEHLPEEKTAKTSCANSLCFHIEEMRCTDAAT